MRSGTRWFLPETPDVLGMLRAQAAATIEGLEALVAWTGGDAAAAEVVRAKEHDADQRKRELRTALTEAFTTPLDQEDLYVMSGELDEVLNGAKNAVRECEVMQLPPDVYLHDMAVCLRDGVRLLDQAFERLRPSERRHAKTEPATDAADAAVKAQRQLERVYRSAMSSLLEVDDLREVMGRRELYRRFSRIGEDLEAVADRVWYAYVKEG
jgi:uncharacterized protein Yka (UPF0111/DUF47 family)